jgi:hypothetical protein
MAKIDFFQEFKDEYKAGKKPAVVAARAAVFLAVDGTGEPGGEAFQSAIEALYAVAWTLKMTRKFAGQDEFKVCALQGAYQDRCEWQLRIRVPAFVTAAELKSAVAELVAKGKPEAVKRVRLVREKALRFAQVMQVGPYSTVSQTVEVLREFAAAQGLELEGPLQEIYLSDPRRVAAEKLRTIVRRAVRRAR